MAKTLWTLVAALTVVGLMPAKPASADDDEIQHVRSSNSSIVTLIQQGAHQSATFRAIVATINAATAIVYVENGLCGRGVHACLVSVTTDGGHRFVRVSVELQHADWDVIGSIGHELRHSIEVLENPSVTTTAGLQYFYLHAESTGGFMKPFETAAAVEAGNAVRAEVKAYRKEHGGGQ